MLRCQNWCTLFHRMIRLRFLQNEVTDWLILFLRPAFSGIILIFYPAILRETVLVTEHQAERRTDGSPTTRSG